MLDTTTTRRTGRLGALRRSLLLIVVSCIAVQSYLQRSYTEISNVYIQRPIESFQAAVDGTVDRPFVTRALTSVLVRETTRLLPAGITRTLTSALRRARFHFPELAPPEPRRRLDEAAYTVWLCLAIASITLLGEGIHRALTRHYDGPPLVFDAAAAMGVLMWPLLITYANFLYDVLTPALVLWTLLMAIEGRWLAYAALLAAGAFHKETMVVVPLAVGYLRYRDWPTGRLVAFVAPQIAGVAAVKVYLSLVVFANNEGSRFNVPWHDNHNFAPSVWVNFLPTAALLVALVGGLVMKDFSQKPRELKALALPVLVPLLLMATTFGYFDELRQYAEGYPGLFCLGFPSLVAAVRPGLLTVRASHASVRSGSTRSV